MLPVYKIRIDDENCGVAKMSLVESPAVESDFLAFAEQKQAMQFSLDDEHHIVFGCALRANFPIYRNTMGPTPFEYYVVFEPFVIAQIVNKFFKENRTSLVTLEHSDNTTGCHLIASFIKDSNNGLNPIGFSDIEDGSWFVGYKIENDAVWSAIKEGKFKGFSVEGLFEMEEEEKDEIDSILDELD